MKFNDFCSMKDWYYFFPLPSIAILKDDVILTVKNISIQFHWLGFHLRWRWIEREGE